VQGKGVVTWAIRVGYGSYTPVEIIRETAKCIFYSDRNWGQTRADKSKFLEWRGEEAAALKLAERLTSASSERERRRRAAGDWFAAEKAKIIGEFSA
jgi:hypothetical protein